MDSVWTVGHSNHPLEVFLELLCAHAIQRVLDVRRFPASRRHPHFHRAPLAAALAQLGIGYAHAPALGGRREPRADSVHTGLTDAALRGYADHMDSAAFAAALAELLRGEARCALLCAEADPAHCHRALLADALLARGVAVHHIRSAGAPPAAHRLHPRARVAAQRVSYPAGGSGELFPQR